MKHQMYNNSIIQSLKVTENVILKHTAYCLLQTSIFVLFSIWINDFQLFTFQINAGYRKSRLIFLKSFFYSSTFFYTTNKHNNNLKINDQVSFLSFFSPLLQLQLFVCGSSFSPF